MTQTDMQLELEFFQKRNELIKEYLNLCAEENRLLKEKVDLLLRINAAQNDSMGLG